MARDSLYDAWIDVGGTFTDCYVRYPTQEIRRCKVLSSGRVPISLSPTDSANHYIAEELSADADDFWIGATLLVLDPHGVERERRRVQEFACGVCRVDGGPLGNQADNRFELNPNIEAPVLGIHRLLGIPLQQPLPALRVRLGTTKGTNALLTRRGAKTALAITSPFEDLLAIGDQTRPDLFRLDVIKPQPLADYCLGVHERLDAEGGVLIPLDEGRARAELQKARQAGCHSLAICLMHSHVNPEHENALEAIAREIGFEDISISSSIAPLIEIVARAQTTVVDAYLSPIIRNYLRELIRQAASASPQDSRTRFDLQVMTSAGGLVAWDQYSGKDSILSGPAGGVCALRAMGESLSIPEIIGLDMGGTSTDVCRVAGQHDLQYESTKAGVRILTPTLPIETVASGGGSVCWFDGVSLRVGPQSAGAQPGPACYGRGGPLTLTDLNVYLKRIPPEQFPFQLDLAAVETRLDALMQEFSASTHSEQTSINSREDLCTGFRKIAIEQMAGAVRSVTIAQGADPRTHALAGFGGAAGQHICEIADTLEIEQIIDSPEAGMLSALGMGLAPQRADAAIPVYQTLESCDLKQLNQQALSQTRQLNGQLRSQGAAASQITSLHWLELRYEGTDTTLTLAWETADKEQIASEFHHLHRQRFGYDRREHGVEVVASRIECTAPGTHQLAAASPVSDKRALEMEKGIPTIARNAISPGQLICGPAIVLNEGSTLFVEANWQAQAWSDGTLVLRRMHASISPPHGQWSEQAQQAVPSGMSRQDRQSRVSDATPARKTDQLPTVPLDPVFRDCYAARLCSIATQMGLVLQQTAVSVNVKQRRDYSCAIFDSRGLLLANAPHVPVHLGAMGQTVRAIRDKFPEILPGDSFITNDPYCGGSHLPDVTVVTPVFADAQSRSPEMFVANRAHHADIGGISPGSMSVDARKLGQEGVVIPPMKLSVRGTDNLSSLIALLRDASYPPRNIRENMADIAAQRAANARGVELLCSFAAGHSWSKLNEYAGHLLAAAEERVRNFLDQRSDWHGVFKDHLDDGTPIQVAVTVSKDEQARLDSPASQPGSSLRIDFAGSGPASQTNFNANPSIVSAAVMYVLRCLIADELPMNEGVLGAVDVHIPVGILNPEPGATVAESPAVAAGNVETSQRVVDVLLGAFDAAAASQGTMNNLLFGNRNFGFYETICGGAGATAKAPGASGVHTHMTNTRLTDPEILESKYPVRLCQFHLRTGSGGKGQNPGGDGVVRELEFLEPVTISLLTSRRTRFPPFGLHGGKPGATGLNVLHSGNSTQQLDGCCTVSVNPGDRLTIQTPGGGGWGESN